MSAPDLRRRLLASTGSATLSQLWRVGVTFATHLVVRRLVAPAEWGLWSWIETVFFVLAAVRDLGLHGQIVRTARRPFGNFLALEAGFGALLAVATAWFAPLLARGWADHSVEVVPVLQALGLYLFFEGLAKVPVTWFECELSVGRAVVPEMIRNLCFSALAILLALAGRGIWSLVVAQVAATGLFALLVWQRAWGRIPLGWVKGATWPMLRAAAPLAATSILAFLVQYLDALVLGARFPSAVVGNYGFAYFVAFLVARVFIPAFGRSIYPALVAEGAAPTRQFEIYRMGTVALVALEAPAAMFLFVNADLALRLLGGGQWVEASDYLRVLAFAPLFEPWSRFGSELLLARHRDRLWAAASLASVLSFLGFGLAFTARFGPIGMAWANYLPLGSLIYAWGVREADPAGFRGLLGDLSRLYLVPAAALLPIALLPLTGGARMALSLGALVLVAVVYKHLFGARLRGFVTGSAAAVVA